jgi:putative DNA primase/helicase
MNLHHAAQLLGGDASGKDSVICPGPGHSPKDRSLSVTFTPDGFVCHSFAGNDWTICRAHIESRLGIRSRIEISRAPIRSTGRSASTKLDFARALWRETGPITATLAGRYLEYRGLGGLPVGDSIHFHKACPFRLETGTTVRLPAMVAKMVDIHTNAFRGVHRTALAADGRGKANIAGLGSPKKMLGVAAGACVKLTADEDVTYGLHIAEGIETALACERLGYSPIRAVLSAGGIAKFPVLPGIECLTVMADNDASGTGENAAVKCAEGWQRAGKEVRIFQWSEIGDFADIVERETSV